MCYRLGATDMFLIQNCARLSRNCGVDKKDYESAFLQEWCRLEDYLFDEAGLLFFGLFVLENVVFEKFLEEQIPVPIAVLAEREIERKLATRFSPELNSKQIKFESKRRKTFDKNVLPKNSSREAFPESESSNINKVPKNSISPFLSNKKRSGERVVVPPPTVFFHHLLFRRNREMFF
ncbi:hypothetical protein CDAR_263951 [Caerostris darwini]|uniref:Uncharacterized protein n=1 Tax=Caerostris darwini TaxID=1538125 RepID=A0AAV4TWP5_9ARAC|nr:hypothetical protein CDAR_263951 [Caerostris darwini]